MKALIYTTAAALALGASAPASSDVQEFCESYQELAERVMTLRQQGYPMSQLIRDLDDDAGTRLVIEAYDERRRVTGESAQRAIEDFGNEHAAACYRELG